MVALVSGVTAMTIGGVALSEGRSASLAVRRKAFVGVALGSILLAAVVFWVLSIAVGVVTTAHTISNPSQFEAQLQQRCVQAEERAGKSQQAATRSCGVESLGTCSTTPTGYTCSSSSTVLVGISTSRGSWLLGAIVLVGWGGVVLAVNLALFRRSSQRQEISHDAR
jgi:type III secretory pathway component EscT